MVYIKDTGILRAGDLRCKYISENLIAVNYKEKLKTIIDTECIEANLNVTPSIRVMQCLVDIANEVRTPIDRDELDKFIDDGYHLSKIEKE